MRHGKKFNHLSRTASHRRAMLANMASSLIKHKRVSTTVAKAKALRTYVEPIITKSKEDTTHSRRVVFSYLQDKDTVKELFGVVAGKVGGRPGGYTRIIKVGNRAGDNADMCVIELVDFNENLLKETTDKPKTRRRRGGKKKVAETTEKVAAPKEEAKAEVEKVKTEEAPAEEVKVEEPKAETKKEEAPKAEASEEPKAEAKEEAKDETPEEKSEESADDSEEKKDKE